MELSELLLKTEDEVSQLPMTEQLRYWRWKYEVAANECLQLIRNEKNTIKTKTKDTGTTGDIQNDQRGRWEVLQGDMG